LAASALIGGAAVIAGGAPAAFATVLLCGAKAAVSIARSSLDRDTLRLSSPEIAVLHTLQGMAG
jgi:hypothetical protein